MYRAMGTMPAFSRQIIRVRGHGARQPPGHVQNGVKFHILVPPCPAPPPLQCHFWCPPPATGPRDRARRKLPKVAVPWGRGLDKRGGSIQQNVNIAAETDCATRIVTDNYVQSCILTHNEVRFCVSTYISAGSDIFLHEIIRKPSLP